MLLANKEEWKWLRTFETLARWVGWGMIALWVLNSISTCVFWKPPPHESPFQYSLFDLLWWSLFRQLFPGILALLVAELLECLLESEARPGKLLRAGPFLLTLAAALYLVQMGLTIWSLSKMVRPLNSGEFFSSVFSMGGLGMFWNIADNILVRAAPVLIFLGLGETLRRALPIIDESKSIV